MVRVRRLQERLERSLRVVYDGAAAGATRVCAFTNSTASLNHGERVCGLEQGGIRYCEHADRTRVATGSISRPSPTPARNEASVTTQNSYYCRATRIIVGEYIITAGEV